MIEARHLTKRFGNTTAVDDVSFVVREGEILGFLGPNGAGKSTVMNMLTGYLSSTAGSVSIGGYDILEQPFEAKKHIGYLPENPPLYLDMTVKEYLYFIYDLKKVSLPRYAHIDEICRLVLIGDVMNRVIKNLSRGYRQRVGIAQALIGNPEALILDEPTVGLDPRQIIEMRRLIRLLGKNHTVILSSHILPEIQAVCQRVIVMNGGKIIADGTPDRLAKKLAPSRRVTLRAVGPMQDILSELQKSPGVHAIKPKGEAEEGAFDFSLEPDPDCDIRHVVSKRMAEAGLPVLMMRAEEPSLEEVFLKITDPAYGAVDDEPDEYAAYRQDYNQSAVLNPAPGADPAEDPNRAAAGELADEIFGERPREFGAQSGSEAPETEIPQAAETPEPENPVTGDEKEEN
ncbi:MAG TPA: ABC transporter [Ruminococcaceae bacterium]|nr:ABC transporter [Oscillospiraceae bacterium]